MKLPRNVPYHRAPLSLSPVLLFHLPERYLSENYAGYSLHPPHYSSPRSPLLVVLPADLILRDLSLLVVLASRNLSG